MLALPFVLLAQAASPNAALDTLLRFDNRTASPGCAVDIRRDGGIVYRRAAGLANLEDGSPIALDTVFEAGSVSKQFVAAGLALLDREGRLSLDDSIRRWLPELPARYAGVTLRMMLHHTSGIRSWNNLAELTGRGEDTSGYDNDWVIGTVARQRGVNNAPGKEYLYSNSNYVLGATVIERASDKPLNTFFHDALFGPLGMNATRWRDDFAEVVARRAQAYTQDATGRWRLDVPLNGVVGAGGLLTTVGDLQRWNAVLENPGERDRFWVAIMTAPGKLADGTTIRYALGLELNTIAGQPAISHAGSTASYRAWLGRVPAAQLSVTLLCNDGTLDTEELGPAIVALYAPPPNAGRNDSGKPASGTLAALPTLAGTYRNLRNDAAVDVTVSPDHRARFNGGAAFVGADGGGLVSESGDRSARLYRDRQGVVVRITLTRIGNAPVTLERVAQWSPAPAELARFAGSYRSREVEGVHRIRFVGTGLRWIDPAGRDQLIAPLYRDAFAAPQSFWTLRFTRDRHGRVAGFDASITRARRVHFDAIPMRSITVWRGR